MIPANHDEIAALAHSYWEAEGHPEGKAEIHWLRALETLAKPAAKPVAKAKKPTKAKAA